MMVKSRGRFNLGMRIRVERETSLMVELMKEGDFLGFEEGIEKVEFMDDDRLITAGRSKRDGEWYANQYTFQDGIIRLNEVDKKRFRSYRATSNYCEEQKQDRNN